MANRPSAAEIAAKGRRTRQGGGSVAKPAAATRRRNRGKPVKAFKRLGDPNSQLLAGSLSLSGLPTPVIEYRFAPPRKWRLDLAYPAIKLAIEVDSFVHRTKSRFVADMEKYNALTLGGWRLIRVLPR